MKRLFTLILSVVCFVTAKAYDFEVDGIYYDITSESQCKVTRDDQGYSGLSYVVIPSHVAYDGMTYSVTAIGDNAFNGCTSMVSVSLPTSVQSIGNYAFGQCTSLSSVVIGDDVVEIGGGAFAHCVALEEITIGKGIQSIGGSAFVGCHSLKNIRCHSTNPALVQFYTFYYVNPSSCVLHVPAETQTIYGKAEVWKNFKHIVALTSDIPMAAASVPFTVKKVGSTLHVCGIAQSTSVTLYNLSGALVGTATSNGIDDVVFELAGCDNEVIVVKAGEESLKVKL